VEQNSNTTAGLNSIQFLDANNGWAFGSDQIINTTDGGSTWNSQSFPPSGYISALQFINLNVGWIISHSAGISYAYKTDDGGISWNVNVQSQAEYFETLYFLNENIGWIAISIEGVLKTIDGGNNWMKHTSNFQGSPMNLWFVDNLVGWISHNTLGSYEISKSTDDGQTWFTLILESWKIINSINFPNSSVGYAACWQLFTPIYQDEGFIKKTTDGGSNWIEQYRDYGVLNSIFFVNDTIGWAVGNGGRILATVNGGITSVEEENSSIELDDFTLYQNYPNPFNPTTNIKYQIPELSFVTLKLYDVLGNEVVTLVNEEKPAGEYNVEFRIDNLELSSGICFYQLRAVDPESSSGQGFVETKKMVLMK